MSRKIAIVGTAEPHWRDAPYADESWEIWSLGGNFKAIPRWDLWMELHDLVDNGGPNVVCRTWASDPQQEAAHRQVYVDWLAKQGDKVITREVWDLTPEATRYPIEEVCKAFPDQYFTSQISYMLALALLQDDVEAIGLWGVDLALSSEYGTQRPSCEFYLGIALGRGVKLHLPPETTLLKGRLYAYEDPTPYTAMIRAKAKETQERLDHVKKAKAEAMRVMAKIERDEAAFKMATEIVDYFAQNMEH